MPIYPARTARRLRSHIRRRLIGPQLLAFLPAIMLIAYWAGGETAMLIMALLVPAGFAFGGLFDHFGQEDELDAITRLPHQPAVVRALDRVLSQPQKNGRCAAALVVAVDNFDRALRDFDTSARNLALKSVAERLTSLLRTSDVTARLDNARFAIALTHLRAADHAMMVELSKRLQSAIAEPLSLSGRQAHLTMSVGFCLPGKLRDLSGEALLEAAEAALAVARVQGGAGIRGYDSEMSGIAEADEAAVEELIRAMDAGEFQPWFQPQVDTESGRVVGLEALARWSHPERGTIMPSDFLPLIEPAGLTRRLGEAMLYGALKLLRRLDQDGIHVPHVSVNFSHAELSTPDLADRIKWELDRFDLAPERLTIEILETALARDTSGVERNLGSLAELGCSIDLDDFGTGNTSIAGVRRYAVSRLKIDRSFVTGIDRNRDQADLVRAILTMARQLKIRTIAEGVENEAEMKALEDLGCEAVQGFLMARPMPAESVGSWIIEQHRTAGVIVTAPKSEKTRAIPSVSYSNGKTA